MISTEVLSKRLKQMTPPPEAHFTAARAPGSRRDDATYIKVPMQRHSRAKRLGWQQSYRFCVWKLRIDDSKGHLPIIATCEMIV